MVSHLHKLGPSPWLKCALIFAQYTCEGKYYGNCVNGIHSLNYIKPERLHLLADLPLVLKCAEGFLQLLVKEYSFEPTKPVPRDVQLRAMVSCFIRVAKAAVKASGDDAAVVEQVKLSLKQAELSLRASLMKETGSLEEFKLPEPILCKKEDSKCGRATQSKAAVDPLADGQIEVDPAPAIKYGISGEAIDTLESRAYAGKNLVLGARVKYVQRRGKSLVPFGALVVVLEFGDSRIKVA